MTSIEVETTLKESLQKIGKTRFAPEKDVDKQFEGYEVVAIQYAYKPKKT